MVLPEALHAVRSLVCLATNETPHEGLFRFSRRAMRRRMQDFLGGGLRDKFFRMCIDYIAVKAQLLR